MGRPLPGRATLVKRVPPRAGLGGGSADAAAMLAALDRAHGLGLDEAALFRLAGALGSDVAFALLALRGHAAGAGNRVGGAPRAGGAGSPPCTSC